MAPLGTDPPPHPRHARWPGRSVWWRRPYVTGGAAWRSPPPPLFLLVLSGYLSHCLG